MVSIHGVRLSLYSGQIINDLLIHGFLSLIFPFPFGLTKMYDLTFLHLLHADIVSPKIKQTKQLIIAAILIDVLLGGSLYD